MEEPKDKNLQEHPESSEDKENTGKKLRLRDGMKEVTKNWLGKKWMEMYEAGKKLGNLLRGKLSGTDKSEPTTDIGKTPNENNNLQQGKENVKCKKETIITTKEDLKKHAERQNKMKEKKKKVGVKQKQSNKKETKMKL